MPTYAVTNEATGGKETKQFEPETSLADARIVLSDFMGDAEFFADKSGKPVPQSDEESRILEDIATGGKIAIIAGAARSIFDEDASDDVQQARDRNRPKEVSGPTLREIESTQGVTAGPRQPGGRAGDLTGSGGIVVTTGPDQIGTLSKDQKAKLLRNNRVWLTGDGTAKAAGFVLKSGKGLDWASRSALHVPKVRLKPHMGVRSDDGSSSYSEWEHEWQQQTDARADAKGGMPLLFKVDTSYRHSSSSAGYSAGKRIYFQFSYRLPKASLILQDVSVTPDFRDEIGKALKLPQAERAPKLLALFQTWGQFVAGESILGGRITLSKEENVTDESKAGALLNEFRAAASASFTIEGAPIEGEAGTGTRIQSKESLSKYLESKSIRLEVYGGIDKSAVAAASGADPWLSSLDKFERWQVIGFEPNSVEPITEFLGDLKPACLETLRTYFLQRMVRMATAKVGKTTWTTDFEDEPEYSAQIKTVRFRHAKLLDSMHTEWVLAGGGKYSQGQADKDRRWWGGARGDQGNGDSGFTLDNGEEISAMEVRLTGKEDDKTVRNVAFYTTFGRRFPASPSSWYGGSTQDGDPPPKRISAPRVRGFCGTQGNYIDSLGFVYYDFQTGTVSPEFLVSIEPYLFPVS